jgi:hypothetical protein
MGESDTLSLVSHRGGKHGALFNLAQVTGEGTVGLHVLFGDMASARVFTQAYLSGTRI